jgi:hypothetical protein
MSSPRLNNDTPYFRLHSQLLPDISMIPNFTFYQGVYYQQHSSSASESIIQTCEAHGHFVGFAESVGHSLTYKILTSSHPRIVVYRSKIRACVDGESISGRNLALKTHPPARNESPPGSTSAGSLPTQHDPGEYDPNNSTSLDTPVADAKPKFTLTSP